MFQLLFFGLYWILIKAECDYLSDNYCAKQDMESTFTNAEDACEDGLAVFLDVDDWNEVLDGLSSWDGDFWIGIETSNGNATWVDGTAVDSNDFPDELGLGTLEPNGCGLLNIDPSANDTFILEVIDCNEELNGYICAYEAPEDTTEAPEDTTEAPEDTTEAPEDTTEAPEDTTEAPEDTTEAPDDSTPSPTETPDDSTPSPTETPDDSTPSPTETPGTTIVDDMSLRGGMSLGLTGYEGDGDPCEDSDLEDVLNSAVSSAYEGQLDDTNFQTSVESCSSEEVTAGRRLLQNSYLLSVTFLVTTQDDELFSTLVTTSISQSDLNTAFENALSESDVDYTIEVVGNVVVVCVDVTDDENCNDPDDGATQLGTFMSLLIILFGSYFW